MNSIVQEDLKTIDKSLKKYLTKEISIVELQHNIEIFLHSFEYQNNKSLLEVLQRFTNDLELIIFMNNEEDYYSLTQEKIILLLQKIDKFFETTKNT